MKKKLLCIKITNIGWNYNPSDHSWIRSILISYHDEDGTKVGEKLITSRFVVRL